MYKKLLLGLCAGVCANLNVYAQFDLLNGAPQENAIVKEPYLFWDLMRNSTPSWIRYSRADETSTFGKSNRLIQRKDASGRFNHLETSIWNPSENKWTLLDKYVYQRTFVDEKLVSEIVESWNRDLQDAPLKYQKIVSDNFFEDNKLIKANNEVSNESGVTSTGESYITYNNLNQRIYDSSQVGNYRFVEHYKFDNNNNCIFNTTYFNGNEVANKSYKYKNSLLTEVKYYNKITPDSIAYASEVYTYDASDMLTEAVLLREVDGILEELYRFTHGYTETGKLKWMCDFIKNNGEWQKGDSIVITYNNNKVDTSYGYRGNANNEWDSYTSFMFVFDEQMVGINSIKNEMVDFSAFPNPANDHVSINIDATDLIKHIAITDVLGKIVYQHNTYNKAIDVTGLQPGIYFITLETNKGKGQKKIIIN
jgi:uncharacterized protein CbrC (UPF0167 family)